MTSEPLDSNPPIPWLAIHVTFYNFWCKVVSQVHFTLFSDTTTLLTFSLPFGILAQAANAILPDEYKLNKLHPEQQASDDKEQEW